MNTCISFSLFEPKDMLDYYREWDPYKSDRDRYFFNIPYIIYLNSIIYDNLKQVVSISPNILDSEYFNILKILSNNIPNFYFDVIDKDYKRSEPIMWRHKEFFDKKNDVVFIRDLDSIPTLWESNNNLHFISSQYYIQTMKTYPTHQNMTVLGGLSGIKPKMVNLPFNSFEDYYGKTSSDEMEVDQRKLNILMFSHPNDFLQKRFVTYSTVGFGFSDFNRINGVTNRVNENIHNFFDVGWTGCPSDFRGEKLVALLSFNDNGMKILNEINHDDVLKKFYKI